MRSLRRCIGDSRYTRWAISLSFRDTSLTTARRNRSKKRQDERASKVRTSKEPMDDHGARLTNLSSVPVYLQDPWRGQDMDSYVGLQYRVGQDNTPLQMQRLLQGSRGSVSCLLSTTDLRSDDASEDAQRKSWSSRYLPQHHWWGSGCTGYCVLSCLALRSFERC